ncbi:MAG: hypothetical protein K2X77_13305 [Candidatus Obscuribacterales bacterium]|jgi:hypothetical protein|nr:hypothetical protein [Candidatus Obscuribacterales bacterium]
MSGAISGPGETAKLMFEALSKASAELEKTVGVLTEQLTVYNQNLEKTFQEEVNAAKERMEAALRQNMDGLIKDRDSVMKALADHKQAEIDKIIESGKTVRNGLASKVDQATSVLTTSVGGKISVIREAVVKPESDMKAKHDETQKLMSAAFGDARQRLISSKATREAELAGVVTEYAAKVEQQLGQSRADFAEKFAQKQTELQAQSQEVLAEIVAKNEAVSAKIESALESGMMSISKESENSGQRLQDIVESGKQNFSETSQSFSSSLGNLSGLLNGLYETQLNNLAAQSKTEIVSAAQHANEVLASTKSELQICLKEFQSDYVAKFEALATRLEKTLEEEAKGERGGLRGLKEERVRDQLNNLFRRLGQEMIDGAANAARRLEFEFQKSIESFESRIETAKNQACESLDRESKLMQKELTRSFHDFERQIADLQGQTAMLEKHGRDAANIVMTIRQANVEF